MPRRLIRRKLSILVLSLVLLTLSATAIYAQPPLQTTPAPTEEIVEEATSTPFEPTEVPSRTPSRTPTITPTPRIVFFANLGFSAQVQPTNLRVISVTPNSVAQRGGLLVGDIITVIEGQTITASNINSLISFLSTVSTRVTITISRAGQVRSLILTVTIPTPFPTPTLSPAAGKLGVAYEIVTERVINERKLTVTSGAYITEVAEGRPAAVAGIKPGDVITEVEGDKVDAKRTLTTRMIPYNTGDEVTLTVVRGSETFKVKVLLGVLRNIARSEGNTA